MHTNTYLSGILWIVFASCSLVRGADPPQFRAHLIDDDFAGGYQISAADVNMDGRPDVIGLSTSPARLVWYENPTWRKHVLTSETRANIDVAPYDIDGDGRPDVVLASAFSLGNSTAGGLLHWLRNPATPTEEWPLDSIGAEPTSHRIRWADIDGNGRKELVNVPIIGPGAKAPLYAVGARLQWYRIPTNPANDPWEPQVIDTTLHMVHGVEVVDWDGDGREDLLTASFEGINLWQYQPKNDGSWLRTSLGTGKTAARPNRGSSEVALGRFEPGGSRFIAAIEPWHGNEVVVYTPAGQSDAVLWRRQVIDSTLVDGHALKVWDFNGDGRDEIVAGFRRKPYNVYLYYRAGTAAHAWLRTTIDAGGMGAAGFFLVDLDGDGDMDLLANGSVTGNIKWYENLTE